MAIALLTFTVNVQAQKLKFSEGDEKLSFLAGQTEVNLEFSYENMNVGKITEAEYKAEKIKKYNEKQPGKGDKWAEKWENSRVSTYEPMFDELINKILFKKKTGAIVSKGKSGAKYTLIVRTTMQEPGFNSYVMKVNPSANYEMTFVETATKKVVAKAELMRVAGVVVNDNDFDFDPSNRIKECYAKAGKVMGTNMAKAMAKK